MIKVDGEFALANSSYEWALTKAHKPLFTMMLNKEFSFFKEIMKLIEKLPPKLDGDRSAMYETLYNGKVFHNSLLAKMPRQKFFWLLEKLLLITRFSQ
jgi:hypothetical protein